MLSTCFGNEIILQNNAIDTLILASGNRNYISLIAELKEIGKKVVILAVPDALSKDLAIIIDDIISYKSICEDNVVSSNKDSDKKSAYAFVVSTLKELEISSFNSRWANLASIGFELKKTYPFFTHKAYKYTKLVEMLGDIP